MALDTLREQIAIINEKKSTTATAPRSIGQLVWLNGSLYRVIADMIAGDTYIIDSNIVKTTIEEEITALITNIDSLTNSVSALDNEVTEIKNILEYNVVEYGAVGDGVTDDIEAIENCIADAIANYGKVYFPKRIYAISRPITITTTAFIDGNGAIIKPLNNMTALVNINIPDPDPIVKRGYMNGFTLDCGYKCNTGLNVARNINSMSFTDWRISDTLVNAINIASSGGSGQFNRLILRNTNSAYLNVVGIQIDAPDCKFVDVTSVNYLKGAVCNATTHFINYHPWNSFSGLMRNSIGIECSATCMVSDSYIDTYAYCFGGTGYIFVVNTLMFWNASYYTDASVGDATTRPCIREDTGSLSMLNCRSYPARGRSNTAVNYANGVTYSYYNVLALNILERLQNAPKIATAPQTSGFTFNTDMFEGTCTFKTLQSFEGKKCIINIESLTKHPLSSLTPILTNLNVDLRPTDARVFAAELSSDYNEYACVVRYDETQNRFVLLPPISASSSPINAPIRFRCSLEYYVR